VKSGLFCSHLVFSLSLDELRIVWRGFNANYTNGANFAKTMRKFAPFADFVTHLHCTERTICHELLKQFEIGCTCSR
jgi:hypothetical protein